MNNKEIAQKVVDRMLDTISASGYLPWAKPWTAGPTNRPMIRVDDGYTTITITPRHWSRAGKPYTGINPLLLDMSGHTGEWITFNQVKAEGGKVRKGAKGREIMYWNMIKKETGELDDEGKKIVKTIPVLKYYTVFSLDDIEGLETKHHPDPEIIIIPRWHWETVEGEEEADPLNVAAESIISAYIDRCRTLTVERTGNSDRAYYSPALDRVVVPNVRQFPQVEEYYSTLFHELGHSTGHVSRLDRFRGKEAAAAWGDENYSREELVAEITAASILSTLGMESGNSFRNSAAYVKSWSEHIKNDPMMFISAAGKASAAIDLILGTAAQPGEVIA